MRFYIYISLSSTLPSSIFQHWRKKWPHSTILAYKTPWIEELVWTTVYGMAKSRTWLSTEQLNNNLIIKAPPSWPWLPKARTSKCHHIRASPYESGEGGGYTNIQPTAKVLSEHSCAHSFVSSLQCLWATKAEMSSCNTGYMTCQGYSSYHLVLQRKTWSTSALN